MRIYRHSILQHKVYSVVTVQTERKMAGLLMKQIHNSEISHRKEAACAVFIRIHSYRNRLACGTLRSLLLDGELQTVTDTARLMDGHFSAEVERFLGRNQIITAPERKKEKRIIQ